MSGPVRERDEACRNETLRGVEVREGRRTTVGGLGVVRVLPTKGRRTVGPWCFVDLLGPEDATDPDPLEVGPHPHIGLSTVTWLLEGEAVHTDSLGTEQVIRPGQLNLMTAGAGVAHAELAAEPPFRGAQMWLAQTEATRHGDAGFVHHGALPEVEIGGAHGLLFLGQLDDVDSDVTADVPAVGLDLTIPAGTTTVAGETSFEYAIAPLEGRVKVGEHIVEAGWLALVPAGIDELPLAAEQSDVRLLVLGGEPLGEDVLMWWNFVARERDEITRAWQDWDQRTDRFGEVASALERIEAPRPPWMGRGG
ncbi:MAG: pirin family protein [Nitriliruptorales bacterium]|nr:pirin family protein [Nitriliruptorales bacterium]